MRILLVEDDSLLGDGIRVGLKQAGFTVDWVQDGLSAKLAIETVEYVLIVLDLGLPKLNGTEILQWLRSQGRKVPVLILTARDTVIDRVAGLNSGADDYLIKPFDLDELIARLRALLRRSVGQPDPVINYLDIELNLTTRRVTLNGNAIDLSSREFAVLSDLLLNIGRVKSREQLEDHLYGWGEEIGSNSVEVHIHHIRKKLGSSLIRTIRGIGYVIDKSES